MRVLALLLAASALLFAQAPEVRDAVQQDPVLRAMNAELQRSMEQLRLENMQRPYYLEYSIVDMDGYSADASFGAIRQEQRQRMRFVRCVVRIGDYRQDSYFGIGEGTMDLLPVDNDEIALRHQLWLITDSAYKQAIQALTQKQALLKQFEGEQSADDFSREQPAQSLAPLAPLALDPAPWREAIRSATALYRADPEVQSLDGQVLFRVQARYYMNSEGTVLRRSESSYALQLSATTQAPDGMRLERARPWVVANPRELPTSEQVRQGAERLIADLAALRKAPLVDDDYHGPVLFAADAATTVFARLVGSAVLGRKPRPGQTSRTVGDYASSFRSRVLPEFISIVDDPTVQTFAGRALVGAYLYDDEGVKARPVNVVEKGQLRNYLLGRQPIRDFASSNGHGRSPGAAPPAPQLGNLFVTSLQPQSFQAMKQRLIEMCRDQGLPYGYIVPGVGRMLAPEMLTRVWVKDGRDELVRGGEFQQLDARALRSDLIAAGDDPRVDNRLDAVPVSIVAPSFLMSDLQIKRTSQAKDKLPDYPPPGLKLALEPPPAKARQGK